MEAETADFGVFIDFMSMHQPDAGESEEDATPRTKPAEAASFYRALGNIGLLWPRAAELGRVQADGDAAAGGRRSQELGACTTGAGGRTSSGASATSRRRRVIEQPGRGGVARGRACRRSPPRRWPRRRSHAQAATARSTAPSLSRTRGREALTSQARLGRRRGDSAARWRALRGSRILPRTQQHRRESEGSSPSRATTSVSVASTARWARWHFATRAGGAPRGARALRGGALSRRRSAIPPRSRAARALAWPQQDRPRRRRAVLAAVGSTGNSTDARGRRAIIASSSRRARGAARSSSRWRKSRRSAWGDGGVRPRARHAAQGAPALECCPARQQDRRRGDAPPGRRPRARRGARARSPSAATRSATRGCATCGALARARPRSSSAAPEERRPASGAARSPARDACSKRGRGASALGDNLSWGDEGVRHLPRCARPRARRGASNSGEATRGGHLDALEARRGVRRRLDATRAASKGRRADKRACSTARAHVGTPPRLGRRGGALAAASTPRTPPRLAKRSSP